MTRYSKENYQHGIERGKRQMSSSLFSYLSLRGADWKTSQRCFDIVVAANSKNQLNNDDGDVYSIQYNSVVYFERRAKFVRSSDKLEEDTQESSSRRERSEVVNIFIKTQTLFMIWEALIREAGELKKAEAKKKLGIQSERKPLNVLLLYHFTNGISLFPSLPFQSHVIFWNLYR